MKYLKRPSPEEELWIYRKFLVDLYTVYCSGDEKRYEEYLKKLGEYSFARTNSTGDFEQDEQNMIRTLLNLDE